MLKKIDFPYMNKGRWYQIRVVSNGKKHELVDTETLCAISGDVIYLQANMHILDMKLDISFTKKKTANVFTSALMHKGDQQGVVIPDSGSYKELVAWVYAYEAGKDGD